MKVFAVLNEYYIQISAVGITLWFFGCSVLIIAYSDMHVAIVMPLPVINHQRHVVLGLFVCLLIHVLMYVCVRV